MADRLLVGCQLSNLVKDQKANEVKEDNKTKESNKAMGQSESKKV